MTRQKQEARPTGKRLVQSDGCGCARSSRVCRFAIWSLIGAAASILVLASFVLAGAEAAQDKPKPRRPPTFLELKLFPKKTPTPTPKPTPNPTPTPTSKPTPTPKPAPPTADELAKQREAQAQKLFDDARDYIKRDRRDTAKSLLQRLAREHPKSPLAQQKHDLAG